MSPLEWERRKFISFSNFHFYFLQVGWGENHLGIAVECEEGNKFLLSRFRMFLLCRGHFIRAFFSISCLCRCDMGNPLFNYSSHEQQWRDGQVVLWLRFELYQEMSVIFFSFKSIKVGVGKVIMTWTWEIKILLGKSIFFLGRDFNWNGVWW
jgi:hypothetical protein